MRAMSGLRRALGEPLLQFIVMGALLFAGYRLVHPERPAKVEDHRIELTAADVRQLEIVWTAQWHRAPTPDELQGLVESRVREEILYREALALGLERGDTIIKRRLAQKMEFLADDLSAVRTPSVEELRAWYSRNSARFADPGRRSFRHLYFSADRRGDRAQQDATRALVKLGRTPADAPALSAIGDPFMFQEHYADRTPEQVAAIFGSHFAEAVRQLPVGTWQGPIESGLGWHLVFVDTLIARPRAVLRGSRGGCEGGMARRAEGDGVGQGVHGDAREVHGAAARASRECVGAPGRAAVVGR